METVKTNKRKATPTNPETSIFTFKSFRECKRKKLFPHLVPDLLVHGVVVGLAERVHLLEGLGVVSVEDLKATHAHRVPDRGMVVANPPRKEI